MLSADDVFAGALTGDLARCRTPVWEDKTALDPAVDIGVPFGSAGSLFVLAYH
jgi:hypothetical protein